MIKASALHPSVPDSQWLLQDRRLIGQPPAKSGQKQEEIKNTRTRLLLSAKRLIDSWRCVGLPQGAGA